MVGAGGGQWPSSHHGKGPALAGPLQPCLNVGSDCVYVN
jgi:hypothetical protein